MWNKAQEKIKDLKSQTATQEAEIRSLRTDKSILMDYINNSGIKANIKGFNVFRMHFNNSETWLDLNDHISRIGSKPLSKESFSNYLTARIDGLINDNKKFGDFSKVDRSAIKKLALISLEKMLNASPEYSFDADSKTYNIVSKETMDHEIVRPVVEDIEL